jgi:CysZ protein
MRGVEWPLLRALKDSVKESFSSLGTAFKLIITDPVNVILTVIPAILGLIFYASLVGLFLGHLEELKLFLQGFAYTSTYAGILSKILGALFVLLIIFVMSWSFVLLVGIIAAPFNSLLSSRIEDKLLGTGQILNHQHLALEQLKKSFRFSFSNEIKKVILLTVLGTLSLLLGLIPFLYPVSLFLIALLLSAQFLDYSWSRHNLPLLICLKDLKENLLPYLIGGGLFLLLAAIPLLNAFLPALGTSFFTVLWLKRQKKISS